MGRALEKAVERSEYPGKGIDLLLKVEDVLSRFIHFFDVTTTYLRDSPCQLDDCDDARSTRKQLHPHDVEVGSLMDAEQCVESCRYILEIDVLKP